VDVSVVLPTYNESANLPLLLPRIRGTLEQAGLVGEVIVVDDASPDGTAAVARDLGARVIARRGERGLASAVLAGFAASEATVVVVMDADGSHPVEQIPEFVQLILRDEAEVVVGSRRIPGGGADADWPWTRRLVSRAAGWLTAGLTGLRDPTSGFMAARRTLLRDLPLDPIGWKIVLEIVVKAQPCRVREVPIVFLDRRHGQSKLSVRVQYDFLRHLVRLHRYRRRVGG
jgi:glycosyltransferase involved in cell wall biosynthesis